MINKIIGGLLLSIPFIALGIYILINGGWNVFFKVFGTTVVTVGLIFAGVKFWLK